MKQQRGFTLLEILVATVIMAIAVGGTLSALSTSMRNAGRLSDYDRAAMFARRKMDELLLDKRLPKMVPLEGQYDPALTSGKMSGWKATITPWEVPPNAGPGGLYLERVQLEIWWMDGDTRRTFALDGFRRALLTEADMQAGILLPKP